MKILVTGGLGFIGSHAVVMLINAGYEVIIIDNLSNSSIETLDKINSISGVAVKFFQCDVRDYNKLNEILACDNISAVMHFAGLKAVGESQESPLEYYDNNVSGTISLLKAMNRNEVHRLVFSSSATVYGEPEYLPVDEKHPAQPLNPYGRTKHQVEQVLEDLHSSSDKWSVMIMRYFNPIGAHSSRLIGDAPAGKPNNIMPFLCRVASGDLSALNIFGSDYNTPDGTGIRDYIHVEDLALGHLAALRHIENENGVLEIVNLGTGSGTSVCELITTFERVNNVSIPYTIIGRRAGDSESCYAGADYSYSLLNWRASMTLEEMCKSAYNFQLEASQDLNVI